MKSKLKNLNLYGLFFVISADEGVLIFINQENENLKTSEEISILEQSNFRILDEKNQVLFER